MLGIHKPEAEGAAAPAILIGLFVSFGGVLFGYDTGTIGGILGMRYWGKLFSTGYVNPQTGWPAVNSSQTSLIVSILSAGTTIGAVASAPIADGIGRRWAMIVNTFVFTFGVILQIAAVNIPLFVAGRFFAGLGVGLLSATIPLYQSETAPKWIRGTIVGCYQWAITIGLLIAAVVLNATKGRNDTGCYRIPIGVQFLFSIIIVGGMLILPETPRYLIKKGKYEQAAKSLSKLRRLPVDNEHLQDELSEIRANHEYEMNIGSASYMALLKPPIRKRLLTGILLQALQQLTGINFIFYYGTTFFQNSGIGNPFVTTMITSVVNVVCTVPGLYLVESWGRRPLLFAGAVGMSVSQVLVASIGTALPDQKAANSALVAFVCLYIAFFAATWGPCAWVVTGEIFPLKARAKGLSITTASNWLLNTIIAVVTPYMVNEPANLHARVFFIWAAFCIICAFFVWSMIYETKGLALEAVDELYAKVSKAWQSKGFQPTISFQEVEKLDVGDMRRHTLADLEVQVERRKSAVSMTEEVEKTKV